MIGTPLCTLGLLLGALTAGCGTEPPPVPLPQEAALPDTSVVPYDFNQPDAAFALPAELIEISGLAAVDSTRLAAVQDEKGILFILDRETARIVTRHHFRGNGDYEGVEVIDNTAWILRSDGRLFTTTLSDSPGSETGRADTDLHGGCDAEGLTYQQAGHRLLVLCKENPGRRLGRTRAVYAFDLTSLHRLDAAAYLVDRRRLDQPRNLFKPSAIAVHPRSGNMYILSSVRKLLIVVDPANPTGILDARELSSDLFAQPEGLAFSPDGALFIASEGVNGAATLLRFNEQPDS